MLYSATKTAGLAAFKTCAVECARDGGAGSGVRFLGESSGWVLSCSILLCAIEAYEADGERWGSIAICPGTIDTGFRRKSTSAIKAGGLEDELEGISSKVGKVLTVQDSKSHTSHPTHSWLWHVP